MLSEILERRRQKRPLRKFSQSVLGDALRIHTQQYLNETILRGISSELKQNIVEQFSNRLIAIDRAPNAFLTFREELCNAAIAYAGLQVLSLTPQEKAGTFSDVRYISGELSRYIRQAADFVRKCRNRRIRIITSRTAANPRPTAEILCSVSIGAMYNVQQARVDFAGC